MVQISQLSETSSTVRRLAVEEESRPVHPPKTAELPSTLMTKETPAAIPTLAPSCEPPGPREPSAIEVTLQAYAALGYALSARALLMLALVGAFVMAVLAIHSQTVFSLIALGLYCAFAILPVAYLEARKRGG